MEMGCEVLCWTDQHTRKIQALSFMKIAMSFHALKKEGLSLLVG
jgi:hypothetical protein